MKEGTKSYKPRNSAIYQIRSSEVRVFRVNKLYGRPFREGIKRDFVLVCETAARLSIG